MSRLARITSALLCLPVLLSSLTAQASDWVPISTGDMTVFIPVAQLDSVQAETFYYGTEATFTLEGFGSTSSIYYQTQQFSNGAFGAFDDWACQSQATLAVNNNGLKLPLSTGRYRVNVAAVMVSEGCDAQTLADFKTNKLISSAEYVGGVMTTTAQYQSSEFMVINDAELMHVDGQVFLQQQDTLTSVKAFGNDGHLTSYDLQLKWPEVTGADAYQLSLYRNDVRFEQFKLNGNPVSNPISTADYQASLATAGYMTIKDAYYPAPAGEPAENGVFSEYTGPGDYTFAVGYCFDGQCSDPVRYIHSPQSPTLSVKPLLPKFANAEYVAPEYAGLGDSVSMDWLVDKRTTQFLVTEQRCSGVPSTQEGEKTCDTFATYSPTDFTLNLPDVDTGGLSTKPTDMGDGTLYYRHVFTVGTAVGHFVH
ncbi:MAG: hypothetical protein HRT35_38765 [Algicola sp.]|nr:hypothetical protein [Algicola sp.]